MSAPGFDVIVQLHVQETEQKVLRPLHTTFAIFFQSKVISRNILIEKCPYPTKTVIFPPIPSLFPKCLLHLYMNPCLPAPQYILFSLLLSLTYKQALLEDTLHGSLHPSPPLATKAWSACVKGQAFSPQDTQLEDFLTHPTHLSSSGSLCRPLNSACSQSPCCGSGWERKNLNVIE